MAVVTDRPKILLVDDRPENLLALEAILDSLDVELVRAGSGEAALRALLQAEFALILLDAQMPGMDGFETAARIKRRVRTKDVPIIFLTAVDKDPNSSYRGYVAGGADYLSKPFDPWILRAKVQVFVDLWAAGRGAPARPPADEAATQTVLMRLDELAEAVDRLATGSSGLQATDHAGTGGTGATDGSDPVELVRARLESLRGALSGLGVVEVAGTPGRPRG